MLCFWRYKVLLYPYTTQFLNYTISLHMKYVFFDTLHLCSSTRPSFLCKNIQIYAGFKKKKKKFFDTFFFTFPIHFISQTRSVKIFYIPVPSEQPNQALFFVCV